MKKALLEGVSLRDILAHGVWANTYGEASQIRDAEAMVLIRNGGRVVDHGKGWRKIACRGLVFTQRITTRRRAT